MVRLKLEPNVFLVTIIIAGSSGPHSVDQRVEELVLELDQSDQRIKEQQVFYNQLDGSFSGLN